MRSAGKFVLYLLAAMVAIAAALLPASAAAGAPELRRLTGADTRVDLLQSAVLVHDRDGSLTAQAAFAASQGPDAQPVAAGYVKQVPDSKQAIWLRFDLATAHDAPARWLLEVQRPDIELAQAFVRAPDGRWTASAQIGDLLPFSTRPVPHRNLVFPLDLPHGDSTVMLRIQTFSIGRVQATLWQPDALDANDLAFFCFTWLYFGIVSSMVIFNLLLYTVVRDRGYLLYVAVILTSGVSYLGNSGLGTQFVWQDNLWWSGRFLGLTWTATTYFRLELTRHFLVTRQRLPRADRALVAAGWLSLATLLAVVVLPRQAAAPAMVACIWIGSILIDLVSIVGVLRRWPGAVYYFACWLVLSAGILLTGARHLGWLPANGVINSILPISAAVSYILLAIALAHQISEERRQKEAAQSRSLAVLHASHALGSETRLDRLHARLREVMMQLTAATSVRFAVWDAQEGGWYLYDEGEGGRRIAIEDAAARGLLPIAALREVERTREPLVVADALRDERLRSDPAFRGVAQCSLMALPIVQHGDMRAVLLLENRERRGAMSAADIDTLIAIAGPLAVSLENVLLYERLEQRVFDQTQELRRTQQELVAAARRAGMAEIATDVLHNVGNILTSVNVAADQIRSRLRDSKTAGLARAVALLDAHADGLGRFLEEDPRGRLLPQYLRELAQALAQERQDLIERAGALVASVDHIKDIVATQQAHAGPTTFAQPLHPAELVEDALRMTDAALRHAPVQVERVVADVAPVRLDKTRVLQILVNLITNARQAMENVRDRPRALRVQMDAEGGKLRFRVQDQGCGIAPEDMPRIFTRGFSKRSGGHGFGLHSCAVAAGEMGGSLTAHSEGAGRGATFTLELPLRPA